MNNWPDIYRILFKQYLIKFRVWFFFLFSVVLIVGIFFRFRPPKEEYAGLLAGICAEDEKGQELYERLQEETGAFRFQEYADAQEMIREIENGTLECGYVLPEGFYQQMQKGKTARQIMLYYAPDAAAHKISYEIVFSRLFEMLSEDILETYFQENAAQIWEKEAAKERLLALNDQFFHNGSTFSLVYEGVDGQRKETPEHLNMLRGLIGILIFFMSLLGLGNCMEQENTWKGFLGNQGRRMRSAAIHVAVFGSVAAGGITLFLLQGGDGFYQEAGALLVYFLVLEGYNRLLALLLKRKSVLYGCLPALLLGSLLFCPVFLRIDRYLPGLAWISYLFPATWYLNLFLT